MNRAPLIVHLLYRLNVGGIGTLLLDCIARMPHRRYRHAIVCLDDVGALGQRVSEPGIELHALHKPPGLAPATAKVHDRAWRQRVQQNFSIDATVHDYLDKFDAVIGSRLPRQMERQPCAES